MQNFFVIDMISNLCRQDAVEAARVFGFHSPERLRRQDHPGTITWHSYNFPFSFSASFSFYS
jgi:hypothetical protein